MGHSLIRRLGEFVRRRRINVPFRAVWEGIGGAGVQRTRQSFLQLLARMPEPQYLVLHTGSNDLAHMPVGALRHKLAELLLLMKAALPRTVIIWSDMLPRLNYRGARCAKTVAKSSDTVNRFLRNFAVQNGMRCIKHHGVKRSRGEAFLPDGVHLSETGNKAFQREIWGALEAFQATEARVFGDVQIQH